MKFRSLLLSAIVLFVALACLLNNQIASLGVGPTPTPTVYIPPVPTFTPTPPPTPTPVPAARIESGEHALTNGDWDAAAQEFEIARQQSSSPDIQGAALLGLAAHEIMVRQNGRGSNPARAAYPELPGLDLRCLRIFLSGSGLQHSAALS